MTIRSLSSAIKTAALLVALVGATVLGAPPSAQAAPAMAAAGIVAPASHIAEIRYGGGHWRHHRHHRRHFGHYRGRHLGHYYGRRHHHHHGRRFRY